MKLENNFTIDAPVEKAWEALNDPETVAPCFPGATLTDVRGRLVHRHRQGEARADLDDVQGQGHLRLARRGRARGGHRRERPRLARQRHGERAKVTASLAADGPDRTIVAMVTDMTITGKPAQFGRGRDLRHRRQDHRTVLGVRGARSWRRRRRRWPAAAARGVGGDVGGRRSGVGGDGGAAVRRSAATNGAAAARRRTTARNGCRAAARRGGGGRGAWGRPVRRPRRSEAASTSRTPEPGQCRVAEPR